MLQGDVLAQHRFILGAILDDALHVIRSTSHQPTPDQAVLLEHSFRVVRQVADELRLVGPEETAVPF